jgi:acetyltransferase AlgX (SGNH hydrolase-like protein)
MSISSPRRVFPLFPCAIGLVLGIVHGFYSARGLPPPRDAFRTPFAELGYVVRYLAGQQPDRVIATRRGDTLHLFSGGDLEMQVRDYGATGAHTLTAGVRAALDTLKTLGVTAVPVLVPTKLSLYREELPYSIGKRGRWSRPPTDAQPEDPDFVHQLLNHGIPEAIDLYEPFRAFRRTYPDRLLFPPLDYHWTSLGSAVAVLTIARQLMDRGLLSMEPQWIDEGRRRLSASVLTDQYPLPRWYLTRAREFQSEEEVVRFQTQPVGEDAGRLIVLGTSFSQFPPEGFLGQLRSVFGRRVEAFVRPNNGYAGGFQMMKDARFKLRRGDLLIWEMPLCCLNLGDPPVATDFEMEPDSTHGQ